MQPIYVCAYFHLYYGPTCPAGHPEQQILLYTGLLPPGAWRILLRPLNICIPPPLLTGHVYVPLQVLSKEGPTAFYAGVVPRLGRWAQCVGGMGGSYVYACC